jgi:hypothetical protein
MQLIDRLIRTCPRCADVYLSGALFDADEDAASLALIRLHYAHVLTPALQTYATTVQKMLPGLQRLAEVAFALAEKVEQ